MSDSSATPNFVEYQTPPLLRGTAIFAGIVALAFAFISFMAWWVEGATFGLWTLPIWLGMAGYWLWQWRVGTQRVRLFVEHLQWLAFARAPITLHYGAITTLNLGRGVLHLSTAQNDLHMRGDVNTLARLAVDLEERVPALHKAKQAQPVLPIVVNAQWQPILLSNIFGLLIAALGGGLFNAAFDDVEMANRNFAMIFGIVMIGMGGVLLYWLFVTFVWRYSFDKTQIQVRHTLRTVDYDPRLLRKIEMHHEDQTHQGMTKRLYRLHLCFADGVELVVQPGVQSAALNYNEVYENVILTKLLEQLRRTYYEPLEMTPNPTQSPTPKSSLITEPAPNPVTRTELDVNELPWQASGKPDYAYQLHSQTGNLTVTLLNYGERQPGAETIHIRLSRPAAGQDWMQTTNGNALFSDSGKLLLLHDSFLPIVIDTATMQIWHYRIAERTFLIAPRWEGERLIGKTLAYGKQIPAAEPFGPWHWDEIVKQWQPGLGGWVSKSYVSTNHSPTSVPVDIAEQLWRQLNFIELNPQWVMLGDGTVFAATAGYALPRQANEHIVGGKVQFLEEAQPRPAAFVMDSGRGDVATIYVKRDGEWRRITEPVAWIRPYVNFADFSERLQAEDKH